MAKKTEISAALRTLILTSTAQRASEFGERSTVQLVGSVSASLERAFGEGAFERPDSGLTNLADACVVTSMVNAGAEFVVSAALGTVRDIVTDRYLTGLLTFEEARDLADDAISHILEIVSSLAERRLHICINADLEAEGKPQFFGEDAEKAAKEREKAAAADLSALLRCAGAGGGAGDGARRNDGKGA